MPKDRNTTQVSNPHWEWLDLPVKSLKLNFCWVCREVFTEFGGKPNFYAHQHHLVPRAFGGIDGPTYSLCNPHHHALHQIALRLEKHKPYTEFLTRDTEKDKRLLWLASIALNAKLLVNQDPNKPMVISFVAKGLTKQRLKDLKKVYKLSYADLIEVAVKNLHAKHHQD